jgi:purine-cytosine permease-like protein
MVFAATMLIIIGTFQAINGLVAIIDDDFYVVRRNYTFDLDTTGWGWIHLILGIVLIVVGLALYARQEWAAISAVVSPG